MRLRSLLENLRGLLKKNLIDNHMYNELKPKGLQLPYLYGLSKTQTQHPGKTNITYDQITLV